MFDYDINIVKIHEIYKQKSDKLCSHEDYLHGCKNLSPNCFWLLPYTFEDQRVEFFIDIAVLCRFGVLRGHQLRLRQRLDRPRIVERFVALGIRAGHLEFIAALRVTNIPLDRVIVVAASTV